MDVLCTPERRMHQLTDLVVPLAVLRQGGEVGRYALLAGHPLE